MQYSFSADPTLSERLFDLIDTVFPGLRQVAHNARALGAPWESVSTPFLICEGERILSHVGVMENFLLSCVARRPLSALSTESQPTLTTDVAAIIVRSLRKRYTIVRNATRRRSSRLSIQSISSRLAFASSRSTASPSPLSQPNAGTACDSLIHMMSRTPLCFTVCWKREHQFSQVVGVINEKAVFCFNEGSRPLYYVADLDVILCLEQEGTCLRLLDVVGPHIPPLSAIVERIPYPVEEVAICFSPDRLAVTAEAKPYLFDHDGPSYLMVRGPFGAEGHAFILPRSART